VGHTIKKVKTGYSESPI